ncbi:MAG: RsmD family RNA methyltransferase [Phycisphaerae bacterium]|nr:RsmD family RNA methyltransferase [Phycisphaerae bacterium]
MRILAGEFKGRVLLSPPTASATRPMTSAAKKSLFDILSPVLASAAVVDLYCGTGTLGLEALSRGAERCWLADHDRRVLQRLRQNIVALGLLDRCTIWSGDVPARLAGWLEALPGPLDLAFVDPPYADTRRWSWPRVTETLFVPIARRLAQGGLVVLRVPSELAVPPRVGALTVRRTQRYGDMAVILLAGQSPVSGAPDGG